MQWHPLFGLGLVTWLWMKACGWYPYVLLGNYHDMHPWKTSAPRFVYHDMVHVRFMPKSVCGPVVLSAYHRQNKFLMQVSHSCSDDGMGLCLYV